MLQKPCYCALVASCSLSLVKHVSCNHIDAATAWNAAILIQLWRCKQDLDTLDPAEEEARLEACLRAVQLDYLLQRCAGSESFSSISGARAAPNLCSADGVVAGYPFILDMHLHQGL